ncbi:MAG: hypothetical protein GX817_03475 [Elusimicrobia bacterium]|nr:hypothetical protein [Elusimicrobiota bacterium]
MNKLLVILGITAAGTFVVWTGIFDSVVEKVGGAVPPPVVIATPPDPGHLPIAQSRPEEAAPGLRFQGVVWQGGEAMAIVNNDIYKENDFINNNRILKITDSYLLVQGRVREFRYNLSTNF